MIEDPVEVVYRVRVPAADLAARADALLLEQTVEVPRRALRDRRVRETTVGRIVDTEALSDGEFRVRLAQPAATTAGDPAQLLNVLFGNSSLQPDVELEDVVLPESLVERLGGPRFGLAGLRRLTGVEGCAMTCSTLKPMGLSAEQVAELCRTFALAGLDVIKDDHGLADHAFCPFPERVRRCMDAVRKAADASGRQAVYVPNLTGTPAAVLEQAALARGLGVEAVMIAPMLVGLPFFNDLAGQLGMPVLAHPALGGAQRIAPRALLGVLYPLYGADAVIFPSFGGRFTYGREVCRELATELTSPRAAIRPVLPVPAGGITTGRVDETLEFYGRDTMLLIGGSLLEAGEQLLDRSRRFVEQVRHHPY